jgi:3-oxoacyl-[acyl-carrier protein] reductase
MKINFTGKTVLITGATRGIGKSIADVLFSCNANLILTGTQKSEIDQLNKGLEEKKIDSIKYFQVDFSSTQSTNLFLEELDKFEKIDVCINNAGVNKIADFVDTTYDDFKWLSEINVNVPYQILQVVGPKMLANGYGRVINIASIWSVVTRPGRSMYSTSKNALIGLTKTLAVEWASKNVLVNAVSPGFTLTELTKSTNTEEQLKAITEIIPAKRMADPIEMAKTIAFLCSDLNTYLTGQNITIDGGFTNV